MTLDNWHFLRKRELLRKINPHGKYCLCLVGYWPDLLMIIGGYLLTRQGMLHKSFIDDATVLVFNVMLPALLFDSIYSSNAKPADEIPLLTAGILGTFAIVPISWLMARPIAVKDRSAFIQGAFRGNVAIVGLAWVEKAFGESGFRTLQYWLLR